MDGTGRSPLKFKLLVLVGRPLAFLGVCLIAYGIAKHPEASHWGGLGVLCLGAGFVSGWTGKIALFLSRP